MSFRDSFVNVGQQQYMTEEEYDQNASLLD